MLDVEKAVGGRPGLRLTVALTAARDGLLIEVADTGIGIPEDELATIFERFRQADSSISRRYGGSGLGLALVKEMAELLGGRATVQSEVGVGSVFRASHPGAVMGKDELIEELWGEEYLDGAISIAVYVRKIREKIEENPAKPAYLKTVWAWDTPSRREGTPQYFRNKTAKRSLWHRRRPLSSSGARNRSSLRLPIRTLPRIRLRALMDKDVQRLTISMDRWIIWPEPRP